MTGDNVQRAGKNAPLGSTWRRDDVNGVPSLGRFRSPSGATCFLVTDPAAGRRILPDGTAKAGGLQRVHGAILLSVFVLSGVTVSLLVSGGPIAGRAVVGFLAGLVIGGIVAAIVDAGLDRRARAAQSAAGVTLSWKIGPGDGRAWRLCVLVVRIAACTAWRDSTIDAGRQVPALLWSAVGLSLAVEQQRRDVERAFQHESLRELAHESLARTERESESMDAVEQNLQRVLIAAWSVQESRSQAVRDAVDDQRRHREERELRARLTASEISDAQCDSDEQVDRSVGLVAEVRTVADLLDATDRILRDRNTP